MKFVFLEGGAGTGKSSICNVLASNGHRVHFESFVELCDLHPQYRPGHFVMSFKWANDMIARMEEFSRTSQRLVFFDRSLLTPYIFARTARDRLGLYTDLMAEVAEVYDCSVVLLHADRPVVRQRLQDRFDRSTDAEKAIRESLNEMSDEFLDTIDSRYEALHQDGAFSFRLDTSEGSVEQVTQRLLDQLGVGERQ